MRILYLANHLNTGGITRYLLTLSCGMIKAGNTVYVASGGGELESEFEKAGAACIKLPLKTKCEVSPKLIFCIYKLIGLVKKYDIDIIHGNTRVTQVTGHILSKLSGRPYVSTCHGFFKPRFSRRMFPCWGRRVIAISSQVKEHLIKDFSVDEKTIVLINHGIDTRYFGPRAREAELAARKKYGLPEGSGIVGIIARLSDVKGHIYLLKAMPQILDRSPGTLLWIIGSGPMEKELIQAAKQLKIEKSVLFTPEIGDTAEALSAMDIFVMPSLKEGLGLALMEAMAAGLAVVGSDAGGIKTLIDDGSCGLLTPVSDSKALADKIGALLADPESRSRLGQNARRKIAGSFDVGKMIEETAKLYSECLN
jgi:glycosyltransferase involved in cell wall biosynthesis